jgi:hypothetical protein
MAQTPWPFTSMIRNIAELIATVKIMIRPIASKRFNISTYANQTNKLFRYSPITLRSRRNTANKRSEMGRHLECALMFTGKLCTAKYSLKRIRFRAWNQLSNKQLVVEKIDPRSEICKAVLVSRHEQKSCLGQ